jgi:hypothetical protein
MRQIIDDPEIIESALLEAGFDVAVKDEAFVVSLRSRAVTLAEVAAVLKCETEELEKIGASILVQ